MKKITILSLHLNYGGIERFITTLANAFSFDYEVEIVSTYKLLEKPFFKLNDNIKVKYLITDLKPNKQLMKKYFKKGQFIGLFKELITSIKILYYKKYRMINYIKQCNSDIIISTRDIHNKWLGKYAKKDILKIGSEHNDTNSSEYIKKVANSAQKLDHFVVVSKKMQNDYQKYLKIPVSYIPNALAILPETFSKLDSNHIITVGRLETVKGYDDLIDVFKIIISHNKNICLDIVGTGSEYEVLNNKINNLGLSKNIKLLGYKNSNELYKLYNNSSIYVMSSISESFGIVLLEAMSHKLPCIAFDSANGAKEIIHNDQDGYLISNRDKQKMADTILELINNKDKKINLGDNALQNSKQYLISNVKQKWVNIFEK